MINIIVVLLLVLSIASFIMPFFYGEKVNNYVKKNKGKLISSEFKQHFHNRGNAINKELIIKYKDQHNNLREVSLYYFTIFSYFGEDKIIKYSTSSPEYAEIQNKQIEIDKKAIEYDEIDYKLSNQDVLTIRQEFTNPNIGEFAFINNKTAPNGKYKIGLFTYIYTENGRITDIK
jgi:hypothetical protein